MDESAIDNPLGRNPFNKDDHRYEDWELALRHAAEEWARFSADHLKKLPSESADIEDFTEWRITSIAGLLDVQAKWYWVFCVGSYEGAEVYVQILDRLIDDLVSRARRNGPHGVPLEYFASEVKIRLAQRKQYWTAEALTQARESEASKKRLGATADAAVGPAGTAEGAVSRTQQAIPEASPPASAAPAETPALSETRELHVPVVERQCPTSRETMSLAVDRPPDDGLRPHAPLFENFPEDDPRHNALVPFFEVMEKFRVLADEYPTLSIEWRPENGSWKLWSPPIQNGSAERYPSAPGSDLHIKTTAGEAAGRLLPSPESWFNPARDPWLDLNDKEPWELWFYAIREFWLNAGEETENVGADVGEFAKVAEAVGYLPKHSAQAIKERHWRKMVKSKTPYSTHKPSTADEIRWQAGEEVGGWLQRGCIQSAFRACAYFCGVLAACKLKDVSRTEESISDVVTRPDLDEAKRAAARAAWLNQKLIEKRWTADTDIAENGGPSYNTVQRYRSGKRSTRDPSVRLGLSTAFGCEFSSVPD
jgi:hypothetical protein